MGKEVGKNVILKVGNGATPTEVFTALAGQRDAKLTINGQSIDVSDKTTNNWGATLAGTLNATVTVSGFVSWPDTTGWDALRLKALAGSTVNFELVVNAAGDKFKGPFSITSFNIGGEQNSGTSYDITLESAGALTWVAA